MKKKIAIVITGMSYGGAERVTSYLANFFFLQGNELTIITLMNTDIAYPLLKGVNCIQLDESSKPNPLFRYYTLTRRLRKTIQDEKPDVILGMMSYSGTIAAIASVGLKIPFIISERNDPNTSTSFSGWEKRIIRFVYRHCVTSAIFQTQSAMSYYYPKKTVQGTVIGNPLYLEDIPAPNTTINETKQIISVGRLSLQKNYALLIEAFSKVASIHPDYSLTIYGEGDLREELEMQIQQNNLGHCVFLPGIEKDIFTKLQTAEMFVLSSDFEGMPNALLEAMAMGLPVISTDYSEGHGILITHMKNGLVVPRMNSSLLAEAMILLIENQELKRELGKEAVKVREELDSRIISRKWLATIEQVCNDYYE
ncbi:MAG: glycosyltransferase family 4 protein [Sphaerochaeta sp.]|nr:glycosyltransferase family 4 protein [Sphaerochaeta sp.]